MLTLPSASRVDVWLRFSNFEALIIQIKRKLLDTSCDKVVCDIGVYTTISFATRTPLTVS